MNDDLITAFVDLAATAVRTEDGYLRKAYSTANSQWGFYRDKHHGVCRLEERQLVYLIFRHLLGQFPVEAELEWSFDGRGSYGGGEAADLAFVERGRVVVAVEVKFGDNPRIILADIQKLRRATWPTDVRRLGLVLWYSADDAEMTSKLASLRSEPNLRAPQMWHRRFTTDWCGTDGTRSDQPFAITLVEAV